MRLSRMSVVVVVALLQSAPWNHWDSAEARAHKRAHTTTTTTTTTTVKPHIKLAGESRIEGGTINENVPSWLGTAWAKDDVSEDDGRLLGHAIGLPDSHFLVHNTASRFFNKPMPEMRNDTILPFPIPTDKWFPTEPEKVAIPTPAKYDITKFQPSNGMADYNIKEFNVANSQFDLIKLEQPVKDYPLPTFDAPLMERDPTQLGGNDCRAYGWSTKLYDQGGSRQGERLPKNRTFVDFPIIAPQPGMCDKYGSCKLVANTMDPYDKALLCGGFNEEGMPVVCGKEKKLTYLLQANNPRVEPGGCADDFRGFHVANIAKLIDPHLGKKG